MRTALIVAAALATGFIPPAVAQQAGQTPRGQHAGQQAGQNTGGQPGTQQAAGCGATTTADHATQGITQGGFTGVEPVAKALVVHAIDPDGNPVLMLITAPATTP